MAKYLGVSGTSFILLFTLCLFVLINEAQVAEAKICQKYSKTWSGWCGNSNHCDKQCKQWEGAKFGSCHWDSRGKACFCYFNCPGLCAKRSKTWSGWCGSSNNCDKQCRTKEGATHGACHGNILKRACDCYFKC